MRTQHKLGSDKIAAIRDLGNRPDDADLPAERIRDWGRMILPFAVFAVLLSATIAGSWWIYTRPDDRIQDVLQTSMGLGSVAISADGHHVIGIDQSGALLFWNRHTGERHHFPTGIGAHCLAVSPDGQTVAVGGFDQQSANQIVSSSRVGGSRRICLSNSLVKNFLTRREEFIDLR